MKRFLSTIILGIGIPLFYGGIIDLIVFVATFDTTPATYIGLSSGTAAIFGGLLVIRTATSSWVESASSIADVLLFNWWK